MMMRKDVKIGVSIAALLLVLLVVYALVPKDTGTEVALDPGDEQPGAVDEGGGAFDDTSGDPAEPAPVDEGAGEDAFEPAAGEDDPAAADDVSAGGTNWLQSLSTGEVVKVESQAPLFSQTETPTPGAAEDADGAAGASDATGDGSAEEGLTGDDETGGLAARPGIGEDEDADTDFPSPLSDGAADSRSTRNGPLTPSGAAGGRARTHTVQQGETIVAIAEAVYGDQRFYPQILRANPEIDPNALKIGTVITLPEINTDASAEQASGSTNAAGASERATDSATEYRVQPGDSLYKISVKLYGQADRVEDLYEMNKSQIGDDPARVKVGMVLKLPEAPKVAQSR